MKVVVTSTYKNVDHEWLGWWMKRLRSLPENEPVVRELVKKGFAYYTSKDPSSNVEATTTYFIDQENEKQP